MREVVNSPRSRILPTSRNLEHTETNVTKNEEDTQDAPVADGGGVEDAGRREVLSALGKYGAYTVPTVVALLAARTSHAGS